MSCWHHTKSICVQIEINGLHHTRMVSIMNIKKQGHITPIKSIEMNCMGKVATLK